MHARTGSPLGLPCLAPRYGPATMSAVPADTPPTPTKLLSVTTPGFLACIVGAVLVVVAGFSVVFRLLEGWSWPDAIYFTCTTAATIGFGDLKPGTSAAARVAVCCLACLGLTLIGALGAAVVSDWISGGAQGNDDDAADWITTWRRHVRGPALRALLLWAFGIVGLRATERMPWGAASYAALTTLTTAGLGDVVPATDRGKLLLAAYSLCGCAAFARLVGTLALIPLDRLRARRRRDVLSQWGTRLSEEALQELSHGELVTRLGLSARADNIERNEFILYMLFLQGKLREEDLAECRRAFETLDRDHSGALDDKDLQLLAWDDAKVYFDEFRSCGDGL